MLLNVAVMLKRYISGEKKRWLNVVVPLVSHFLVSIQLLTSHSTFHNERSF
jgi:hypothetical protein